MGPASQDSSHVGNARVRVVSMSVRLLLCLLLPLLGLSAFFTVVVLFDAYFLGIGYDRFMHLVSCMVIMVLILMRSSMPEPSSCSMLLQVSAGCSSGSAQLDCW